MGWLDTLFGNYDHTGAAVAYTAANEFSWGQTLGLPALQALANIEVMNYQRGIYDEISEDQKDILDFAVERYLDRTSSILNGASITGAYGAVPEAALYEPVDSAAVQATAVEDNIRDLGRASRWGQCIGRLHAQNDRIRMALLDPRWVVNMDLHSMTLGDLFRGKMAPGDLMEVMTDTAEAALATGRIGGVRAATTRNIAAERLRRQARARKELLAKADMMANVSPSNRMPDLREMLRTPEQRIAYELTQAQLVQNSLQNLFNRRAQAPPWRAARLQLQLTKAQERLKSRAMKAQLFNQYVPNYAAILQPMISSLLTSPKDPANPFTFSGSMDLRQS